MIQFALTNNGPSDLPLKKGPSGMTVTSGDLAEMHESRRRITIDQVRHAVLAEQLGFHYCFFTEHHFQIEGAEYNPNPLILGAAIASRTKRIRIGQIGNILSWWHPIRLAEQAAMVDVLSGGRLEFGIGRGSQPREMEVFGQVYGSSSMDEERTRRYCDECYEIILKAWTEPSFSYRGEFFSIPPKWAAHHHPLTIEYLSQPGLERSLDQVLQLGEPTGRPGGIYSHGTTLKELSVYPQPVQKPHPQVWVPVVHGARTIQWAAREGVNTVFVASELEQVRSQVATYHEEAKKYGFPDRLKRGEFKYGWDCERNRGVCHFQGVHIVDHGIGNMERAWLGSKYLWDYLAGFHPAGAPTPAGSGTHNNSSGRLTFFGSTQQIIDGFMALKEIGGSEDFLCAVGFTFSGISGEEGVEQLHAFAQDVMPVLTRACGGSPEPLEPDPSKAI